MKFFQLKSIRTKLIIAAILLLSVPIIVLGYFSYQTSKNSLDASGAKRLETSVELTIEMAERLNEEVEKGNLTLEEAQEMVKISILGEKDEAGQREINPSLDLGEHGYMFINNSEGTLQAHPNIEGENTWDRTDANGDLYAQDYIKTALDGGGLSYYPYPLPNDENQIEEKVTYSKAFPAWDWVIIGSTYMLDFNSEAKDILNVIYLVIGITLIIGLIIIWFFSDSLATTLQTVATRMNQIADGDLSEPLLDIKTKDETGQLANALNKMQTGLTNLIRDLSNAISTVTSQSEELNQAAYEVSEGAEQITATMEELASGAESQANDSAEASSMMSSFITIVDQAHEEGESIKNGSNEVLSLTEQGQKLMNTSTEQMNTIDHIVNDAVEKVEGLNTHSQEISAIVSVIQDIAEQTNLLALNAAIEAARAGEHGQGFSVVAEEVRELAEESAESVTDITQIVEQIQSEANIVAHSLKESYEEVEQGTTHMQTTSNTFNEISNAVTTMAENISNVSHNLANIATNSNEMSNAIENIAAVSEEAAAGIEQSTAVTEQSNAAMQEVAGSSEDLAQLAESLSESIEQFRL